jgi:molecular chaperone GrpE
MKNKTENNKDKKSKEKNSGLSKKFKKIQQEKDEYLGLLQRCKADFLNYKMGEGERLKQLIDYEKEEWVLELLSILDYFEKAREEIPKKDKDSLVLEGFLQIQRYFENFLKKQGIEEIEVKKGVKFNPNFEEVIETVEDNKKEDGTILEIIQKGYKYGDKIIRPTRVKVSKK